MFHVPVLVHRFTSAPARTLGLNYRQCLDLLMLPLLLALLGLSPLALKYAPLLMHTIWIMYSSNSCISSATKTSCPVAHTNTPTQTRRRKAQDYLMQASHLQLPLSVLSLHAVTQKRHPTVLHCEFPAWWCFYVCVCVEAVHVPTWALDTCQHSLSAFLYASLYVFLAHTVQLLHQMWQIPKNMQS